MKIAATAIIVIDPRRAQPVLIPTSLRNSTTTSSINRKTPNPIKIISAPNINPTNHIVQPPKASKQKHDQDD